MKKSISQPLKYILMAMFVVPVTIISHELGHFVSYLYFGADDVRLLAFSVSAETDHLSPIQIAVSSILGPLISYITIVIAALMTRKQYSPFWILLGIAAPIGRIVNAVYIYFRILGNHPNPNFDEYKFSRSLKIEPLFVSVPTMVIVVAVFYWFGRSAWKHGGIRELGLIILSVILGLAAWTQIGPMIL